MFAQSGQFSRTENHGKFPQRSSQTSFYWPASFRTTVAGEEIEGVKITAHKRCLALGKRALLFATSSRGRTIDLQFAHPPERGDRVNGGISLETFNCWGDTLIAAGSELFFTPASQKEFGNNYSYLMYKQIPEDILRFYTQYFACRTMAGLSLCHMFEEMVNKGFGGHVGNEGVRNRAHEVLGSALPFVKPPSQEPLWSQYRTLRANLLEMQGFITEHPDQLGLNISQYAHSNKGGEWLGSG